MKQIKIKELIKRIVTETLNNIEESHQTGEWWIDDSGGTMYCDNTVSDQGHEGMVITYLVMEILSHFGIDVADDPKEFVDCEEDIKNELIDDDSLTPEELADWDKNPATVIVKKLIEMGAYKDPVQAKNAVMIAYGNSSIDARDYAMMYWKWKIMKTVRNAIEIQTWHLTSNDIELIVRGIWDIMDEDNDDPDDSDTIVGDDNYQGPRVNVTVQSIGKRYTDIPLAVLEKKMPSALGNYKSGLGSDFLNEGFHYAHKEYRMYEGHNKIVALFDDNSRLMFEVHYHDRHKQDKALWRRRAFTTWKSAANEIHSDVQLTEAGNPIQKTWKQAFKEALNHPKLKDYIRLPHHQRIFDGKGKSAPCMDPVNFSKTA